MFSAVLVAGGRAQGSGPEGQRGESSTGRHVLMPCALGEARRYMKSAEAVEHAVWRPRVGMHVVVPEVLSIQTRIDKTMWSQALHPKSF